MDEPDWLQRNRELWDTSTRAHLGSRFYDVEGFRAGRDSLNPPEIEALGELEGQRVLHLQCHFGMDTLSLARRGAVATGVDLSGAAIRAARELNGDLGLGATFVESDLYGLPDRLDAQFDLVFTSYGALGWLPDLERWAQVVHHFLAPGGRLLVVEFHPGLYLYDHESGALAYSWFNDGEPHVEDEEASYTGEALDGRVQSVTWSHALSDLFGPLLRRGYTIEDFTEFDWSPYDCLPNMRERAPGEFVWGPEGISLPHLYRLQARRPA